MSENLGLGKLITTPQQRDAIHIAIAPVVAVERLKPGQRAGFDEPGNRRVRARLDGPGIVDPFLQRDVEPEQEFWLWLDPGSVTGLRHDWSHPAFAANEPDGKKAEAVMVMERFANDCGVSYEEAMQFAKGYAECGHYKNVGEWEGYKDADWDSMWNAYEVLTGTKVESDNRGWFFNCSC